MTLEKATEKIKQSGKQVKVINNFCQTEPKTLIVTNSFEQGETVCLVVGSFDLL